MVDTPRTIFNEGPSGARIEAAYPVRLRSVDIDDCPFREETVLQNLSGRGLYFAIETESPERIFCFSRSAVAPDGEIPALRLAARGTVLRVDPQRDGSYGVAIEFRRRRVR